LFDLLGSKLGLLLYCVLNFHITCYVFIHYNLHVHDQGLFYDVFIIPYTSTPHNGQEDKNVTKSERSRRVFNKDMYLILPLFQNFSKSLSLLKLLHLKMGTCVSGIGPLLIRTCDGHF